MFGNVYYKHMYMYYEVLREFSRTEHTLLS